MIGRRIISTCYLLPSGFRALSENNKNESWNNSLSKFLGTSKKVSTVADFIFDQVKNDRHSKTLDVLSICDMLTRRFKPY